MTNKKYDYNNIDEGFYDDIFNKRSGVRSAWHHIKFNFIKEKIKSENRHLDIGCGGGTFISLLKNECAFGIDISKKQIEYANKVYGSKNKKFFCYQNDIPFENDHFDSISIIELIEHLSDEEISHLINQIDKVLKKGGKIYITTPNYLSLWPFLEFFLNKISKVSYEHQHINKFNFLNIAKIIDKKKYKITQKNSFIHISPFMAFFSFRFSIFFSKIERMIFKFFPGFLLFIELEKK